MPNINQLYVNNTASAGDLVPFWSQTDGAARGISLSNLAAVLQSLLSTTGLVTQYSSPQATGFNVAVAAVNTWLIVTPAAGYATGTITLPAGVDRSEVLVNCSQAVTTLTITPSTGDTVAGAPTTLIANDTFRLRYDGVMKLWHKVA